MDSMRRTISSVSGSPNHDGSSGGVSDCHEPGLSTERDELADKLSRGL